MGKLRDSAIKTIKGNGKTQKLFDGEGLYLLVSAVGGKSWKYKYRLSGKEQLRSLGSYPEIGLGQARDKLRVARAEVALGKHPLELQRAAQKQRAEIEANTFGSVAETWIQANTPRWADYYAKQVRSGLDRYLFKCKPLWDKPIRLVESADISKMLRAIAVRTKATGEERKATGAPTVARNVRIWCGMIFRYAIDHKLAEVDPTPPLRSLPELERSEVKSNKKLSGSQLGDVVRRLRTYNGDRITTIAIEFLILTMVRTVELRKARWDQFRLDESLWLIPPANMKAGRSHEVPLSKQVLALLTELQTIVGSEGLLFPGRIDGSPISATTINRALEYMKLNGPGTIGLSAHGFRGTAGSRLRQLKFDKELIEIQLAHKPKDRVAALYNDYTYFEERAHMLQVYADYVSSQERATVIES